MLDVVASYHCIQIQIKRMIQTQENGKKIFILGLILAHWAQIRAAKFFFFFFFFQKSGFVNH